MCECSDRRCGGLGHIGQFKGERPNAAGARRKARGGKRTAELRRADSERRRDLKCNTWLSQSFKESGTEF